MVVGGKSWLHESDLRVGRKSLLLESEIHRANVVVDVDFRWSLLLNVVTRAQNWSSKLVAQEWSVEFVVRGGCWRTHNR